MDKFSHLYFHFCYFSFKSFVFRLFFSPLNVSEAIWNIDFLLESLFLLTDFKNHSSYHFNLLSKHPIILLYESGFSLDEPFPVLLLCEGFFSYMFSWHLIYTSVQLLSLFIITTSFLVPVWKSFESTWSSQKHLWHGG